MKQITTTDGTFSTTGFDFRDLKGKARENAIQSHYNFLSSVEDEEIGYDEDDIIENIEVNEYIFDLNGELLPMTTYTGKHKLSGQHSINSWGG